MIRTIVIACLLAGISGFCQSPANLGSRAQTTPDSQKAISKDDVAPDAAIITIHGYCPGGDSKSPKCITSITRQQFESMLSAINVNSQFLSNPVALRSFAESYVQSLSLAEAAERSGTDKDPKVAELLRVVRLRTLADAYRRQLQQEYGAATDDEIEAYYKQNMSRYEQVELNRIAIPLVNPKLSQQEQAEFAKKAQRLAAEARERAAQGDDMNKLQMETYKSLGLTPPLTTDLGTKRKGTLPAPLEQELFSLKPGGVSKVETDPATLTIYRVRSHTTLSLETVKPMITQEIQQKRFQEALQSVTGDIQTEYKVQYFGAGSAAIRTMPAAGSAR